MIHENQILASKILWSNVVHKVLKSSVHVQWLCCITRWTLDSVRRLQRRLSVSWGRLKSHTVSTWRGKGGDRLRMLQWSCRTVWLVSHGIPTYLNTSLQGDPSATICSQFMIILWKCETQFRPQPTVYFVSCKHWKGLFALLKIKYKCIRHILSI